MKTLKVVLDYQENIIEKVKVLKTLTNTEINFVLNDLFGDGQWCSYS